MDRTRHPFISLAITIIIFPVRSDIRNNRLLNEDCERLWECVHFDLCWTIHARRFYIVSVSLCLKKKRIIQCVRGDKPDRVKGFRPESAEKQWITLGGFNGGMKGNVFPSNSFDFFMLLKLPRYLLFSIKAEPVPSHRPFLTSSCPSSHHLFVSSPLKSLPSIQWSSTC